MHLELTILSVMLLKCQILLIDFVVLDWQFARNICRFGHMYSKIPPKIKTNFPLKSRFKKLQSFFLCFSALSVV